MSIEINSKNLSKMYIGTPPTDATKITMATTDSRTVASAINENKDNITTLNQLLSNAIIKDGSVQMTGVLKTLGIPVGKTESEQIDFDGATICRTIDGVRVVVNAYLDADGSWKRKEDGTASVVNISALELGYFVADSGLANTTITWISHSPLPLTGGTLTGNLVITTSNNPFIDLRRTNESARFNVFKNSDGIGDYGTVLADINSIENAVNLRLWSGASQLSERLRLEYANVVYKIYGEHNITVSTTAPSSALAEGAQHQVYA